MAKIKKNRKVQQRVDDEVDQRAKSNMRDMFWDLEVPNNSSEFLGMPNEKAIHVGICVILAAHYLSDQWQNQSKEIMFLQGICDTEHESQTKNLLYRQLFRQGMNTLETLKKYTQRLSEYGLLRIEDPDNDGAVYELEPLFTRLKEAKRQILANDGAMWPKVKENS